MFSRGGISKYYTELPAGSNAEPAESTSSTGQQVDQPEDNEEDHDDADDASYGGIERELGYGPKDQADDSEDENNLE